MIDAPMIKTNISRLLYDDCSYCVGDVFQYVASAFKSLDDILILDQLDIVGVDVKEIADKKFIS